MPRPIVLNIAKDALSVPVHTPAMKWLIRNKENGLYLKNIWTWTANPSEAHVFPNGLSLVQFCLRHKVPPMDMIPLPEGGDANSAAQGPAQPGSRVRAR